MEGFEKYVSSRINKDIAPDAKFRNGDRMYLPGDLLDALNLRYKNSNGAMGVDESTPGSTLKNFLLPSGTNKCIGCFLNKKENMFIYFIANSNAEDSVIEWNPDTNVFATLLQGDLGFDPDFYITQGGCIDDVVIWNDRQKNVRSINIIKARLGTFYTPPYSKYILSLATKPPLDRPTFVKATDSTYPFNNIAKKTYQFSYQFVYFDNRLSTFGPLSELAWIRLTEDPVDNTDNALDVTVKFPIELAGIVKQINVAFREGNVGNYFIFNEIKNPTDPTYTVRFINSGKALPVSTDDQNRLSDYIPSRTEALDVVKSRIFIPLNKTGFNVDDSTFSLTFSLTEESVEETLTPFAYRGKRFLKNGGNYIGGVVFLDDFGKTTFVKASSEIRVPVTNSSKNVRYVLNWILTGTPPPGFVKMIIVLTPNKFHATYFQCGAIPHLYERDLKESENDNVQTDEHYSFQGKRFFKMDVFYNTHPSSAGGWKGIYLQIPLNPPFIPDTSCLVRIMNKGTFKYDYMNILGVVGDFVLVDDPYTTSRGRGDDEGTINSADWRVFPGNIEILKTLDAEESIFHEISESYDITNDEFTVLSGKLYGDTYNIAPPYNYTPLSIAGAPIFKPPVSPNNTKWMESPTGLLSSSVLSVPQAIFYSQKRPGSSTSTPQVSGTVSVVKVIFTLDYNKSASDFGRAHTIYSEEKEVNLYSTLGFSNTYVQNSFINGLNTFLADNQYSLAVERGPIRGLINVGGVLLAIHERYTSSLYIEEGFMRQSNDFILTKTDKTVGDDRELASNYGTLNPESMIRVFNLAFWWDGIQGAVVQYSQAGLYPISNYGMRDYFLKKSKDYFPYRNQIKVVTAFDYSSGELIITLPDVKNEFGGIIIAGETWAFNLESKEWVTRYSYIPEMYGNSNNHFVAFKNGQLWLQNSNPVHNNFFGVQYTRKKRFVANPHPGKNKRYLNLHLAGALCTDPLSETFNPVRVYTKEGQESFIPAYEFELTEGKWCAPILKDINTPNVPGDQLALRSGDDIVSPYLEVEVENDRTDKAQVSEINVIFNTEEFSL